MNIKRTELYTIHDQSWDMYDHPHSVRGYILARKYVQNLEA